MVSFGIHSISHPKSREIWYSNNVVTYLVLLKSYQVVIEGIFGRFSNGALFICHGNVYLASKTWLLMLRLAIIVTKMIIRIISMIILGQRVLWAGTCWRHPQLVSHKTADAKKASKSSLGEQITSTASKSLYNQPRSLSDPQGTDLCSPPPSPSSPFLAFQCDLFLPPFPP